MVELPDGTPKRCSRCSPSMSRDQAAAASERAWLAAYGSLPPGTIAPKGEK
jgi:hypothetical protein